jgi:FKBP-type peptidyl-prolyl cis-trans isomerase FklB
MKKLLLCLCAMLLLCTVANAEEKFKTEHEKVGYAIGMNIGLSMKQQQVDADPAQIAAGLKAAFAGDETLLTTEEMSQTLIAFQQRLQQQQLADNAEAANAFLQDNAKKDGVVTLPSGLQYKVLSSGSGATPKVDSQVQVHYRGTLIDGTEFDSSYSRNEPVSFPVNGVIAGWTEALQLMKEGDKWQLVIPPQLAYAERGAPPAIPPNSALIFEVELLKVD